jgi:hypothetical protein
VLRRACAHLIGCALIIICLGTCAQATSRGGANGSVWWLQVGTVVTIIIVVVAAIIPPATVVAIAALSRAISSAALSPCLLLPLLLGLLLLATLASLTLGMRSSDATNGRVCPARCPGATR